MTTKLMPVAANNDAELVAGTLAGNRDAFSQIVSRYQSLICSLTYSATGNLGQSEDLAQETFVTAWKHLGRFARARQAARVAVRHRAQPHQQFAPPRRPRTESPGRIAGGNFRIPFAGTAAGRTHHQQRGTGHSLALARTHPGNLPRAARSVLPRTPIHRGRRARIWN